MSTKKEIILRRDESQSGCDISFNLMIRHYEGNRIVFYREVMYFHREIDGHYVVIADSTLKTSGYISSDNYEILGVRHDKKEAEDYCLEQVREMARGIARSLDVEVEEFGFEEEVVA